MKIGKIETDGSIIGTKLLTEREFRNLLHDTYLPKILTDEIVRPLGYACLEAPLALEEKMKYNQVLEFDVNKKEDGTYERIAKLVKIPEDVALIRKERKWKEVRLERDKLLKDSDFSQTVDSNTKYIYENYRQKLRDLPQKFDDPFLVVFPKIEDEDLEFKEVEQYIQNHITSFVKSKGYDNENSISKYLIEGNPFYKECKSISLWIGNVWLKVHEIKDKVINSEIPKPTKEEFLLLLPSYVEY